MRAVLLANMTIRLQRRPASAFCGMNMLVQVLFPGEFFRQMTKECMWENRLYKNELVLGGRRVDLGNIKVPVLHAIAQHDHIVPYDAAKPLIVNVGSKDKEEIVLKGGHVSLVAGPNAVKRLWPNLDAWLQERST